MPVLLAKCDALLFAAGLWVRFPRRQTNFCRLINGRLVTTPINLFAAINKLKRPEPALFHVLSTCMHESDTFIAAILASPREIASSRAAIYQACQTGRVTIHDASWGRLERVPYSILNGCQKLYHAGQRYLNRAAIQSRRNCHMPGKNPH